MNSSNTNSKFWRSLFRRLVAGGAWRQPKWDWRGWLALAWALWFGWLYSLMVIETKFPQVLAWLRAVAK
jgi:hypothetical protein